MGVSNDAMGNSSPVHAAVQPKNNPTSARKVGGTSIGDPRTELEELREVLRSFSKTLTKIGLAMNHIMGEMPPARSESIIRSIKEDLRRMSPNPA
ncbi:hypothetical protein V496_01473 [Pseudogymnoascus sp. VKM F-4515 (FW-2607)]|nr:hypothetical protein V496_01473 [Pseudogymnoascus sp. VKM F-4515 (FW-2607)]